MPVGLDGGGKRVGLGMCMAPENPDSFSEVENREEKRKTEEMAGVQ